MTKKKIDISPSFRLLGYSVKEWLAGTKESFKVLVSALTALAAYFGDLAPIPWNIVTAIIVAPVTKWVLDLIDFWVSDVTLKK